MPGVDYRIGDALEALQELPAESVSWIHLDDAWARPMRNGAFGVEYNTHAFDETDDHFSEHDTSLTTAALVDECHRVLEPGGLLVADTDDWLYQYVREEWGETQAAAGNVTLLASSGEPDRSTPGMYLSTGGYSLVLAWKQASPWFPNAPRYFQADRQREQYGWSSAKPLAPYWRLLETYCSTDGTVVVPGRPRPPSLPRISTARPSTSSASTPRPRRRPPTRSDGAMNCSDSKDSSSSREGSEDGDCSRVQHGGGRRPHRRRRDQRLRQPTDRASSLTSNSGATGPRASLSRIEEFSGRPRGLTAVYQH